MSTQDITAFWPFLPADAGIMFTDQIRRGRLQREATRMGGYGAAVMNAELGG
jgi:hypothetical protein